jgi:hypothetical protein
LPRTSTRRRADAGRRQRLERDARICEWTRCR